MTLRHGSCGSLKGGDYDASVSCRLKSRDDDVRESDWLICIPIGSKW